MRPKKKRTTVALDAPMDALLRKAARSEGIPSAEFVRRSLALGLEQYRVHPRPRSAGTVKRALKDRGDERELFRTRNR